jgi:hypothetical protein
MPASSFLRSLSRSPNTTTRRVAGDRVDVPVGRVGMDVAAVPPLRSPTRLTAARKRESGCSGPFGFAQGRRDDKSGKGANR